MPYPLLRPIANRVRAAQTPLLHRLVVRPASCAMALPTGAAIVIAPHADDETFGCGGLIALKRAAGVQVSVVVVTDGSQSQTHGTDDGPPLVDRRREEVLSATRVLGVEKSRVHFLGALDGGLAHLSDADREQLAMQLRHVILNAGAREIYVPHHHDRHPDHEATYQLTVRALSQAGTGDLPDDITLMEYLVWLVWKRPLLQSSLADLRGAARLDVSSVQSIKDEAIAAYRSQLPTMPPGFLPQFKRGEEYYWQQPWRRGVVLNPAGRELAAVGQ